MKCGNCFRINLFVNVYGYVYVLINRDQRNVCVCKCVTMRAFYKTEAETITRSSNSGFMQKYWKFFYDFPRTGMNFFVY